MTTESQGPDTLSEELDPTIPVPLGYSNVLGQMDLLDLDLEWEDLATGDDPDNPNDSGENQQLNELEQDLHYLNVTQQTEIFVNQTKPKEWEYKKYQPFWGWKPLEVIKHTFAATTQFAAVCLSPPLRRHYKS